MSRHSYSSGWISLALVLGSAGMPSARADDEPIRFETHVLPILETRCFRCHGETQAKGGLDLRRKFTMLRGGDSGPALVPGQPENSLLLTRVEKGEMPPAKEEAINPRHLELLRRWVKDGAQLARADEPPLKEAETATRISEEDRRFWSFQPPRRPAVPSVKNTDRVRTPIDAFLLAKLEAKGLSFNPDASREVLLRRVYYDLTGLPPTPQEQRAFLEDDRPDAYERLVDRLLRSPAYGERWGRHWLDLAGYADSDGYLAADRLRPEAWRYRDYVIRALNDDMPYDQFLTEQLAGDELSNWRGAEELTPDMIRQLTATGFLRTALDPTYPGYTEPNEIHQVLSDTMQIIGTTTLGLTLHCARCHAHKFDPVSQRDYYAFQTVFLPALDPARWQPSSVRGIPLATDAEQTQLRERNAKIAERLKELGAMLAQLQARYRKKAGDAKLKDEELFARFPEYKIEFDRVKSAIAAEEALKKEPVLLRGLTDLDGKPPEGHILLRGEYTKPGAVVEPGVPEVLALTNYRAAPREGSRTTGRRLALARWLTDPTHPLTARVQVNRMWRHHFGRGIVPTVANFGRSGAMPTHPELLDWLAVEFVEKGWSLKHMHRLMLLSTAYRQTSEVDQARKSADPENHLLGSWRPRRHEGEVLRDSVLFVSGKLNRQSFGPPAPVKMNGDGSVETNDDPQGNRRSIYLIVRRSQHLTLLDLFDTPMMEINCPERTVSTAPLQALALLHGPFMHQNAAALADRILREASTPDERITLAYRLLFARDPRRTEVEKIRPFLDALVKDDPAGRAPWVQLALVLLNSNEFTHVH